MSPVLKRKNVSNGPSGKCVNAKGRLGRLCTKGIKSVIFSLFGRGGDRWTRDTVIEMWELESAEGGEGAPRKSM